jgi:hypothetical protein
MTKGNLITNYMFEITEMDALPLVFNEKHWAAVIDRVTVHEDERLVFKLRNGMETTERL